MAEQDWREILKRAVNRSSAQAVADQLELSRTMISLVVNGRYEKSTATLQRAVLAKLDIVDCPHLARELVRSDCDGYRARPVPQSDAEQLRHYVACKRCPVHRAAAQIEDRRASHG